MKAIKEVYVVSEYGGEYEDKWEHVVGVFSTEDLAKEYVKECKKNKGLIPREIYKKLLLELDEKVDDPECEHSEAYWINQLHPEYSIEQIEKTDYSYYYGDSYYWIEKINYYGE